MKTKLTATDQLKARPVIWSYGAAVLSVAVAYALARAAYYYLHSQPFALMFLCAILCSAWVGGIGPALLAVALSILVFAYYFLHPTHTLAISVNELPRLIIFATIGVTVGFLTVSQRSFTASLRRANESLQAEILERKQAEQKLRYSREQFRALTDRLESLREAERIRISREIHDELGQKLTGLKMDLLWMERKVGELESLPAANAILDRVVRATESVDGIVSTVQEIAAELRPSVLDKLGLNAALHYESRRFQERTGILCEARLPETEPNLSTEVSTTLFRIFQECLTNVARHAQATKVEVELQAAPRFIVLSLRDNGKGIKESEIANPQSLGLLGMKERVAHLGGEIVFASHPGEGTIVKVRAPTAGAALPTGDTV